MAINSKNPKVDAFINRAKKWQQEFELLRSIVLDCELTEELKWGVPCYTHDATNVVLIHGFKDYCALLFFKGALINNTDGILIQQTKNVQAGRQIRFSSLKEISSKRRVIKSYINQAIEIEKAGLKVNLKKTNEFSIPDEFQKKLKERPALKTAFKSLTPGRQRAYILYFSAAKQSKTREARIEKYSPQILNGKGLHD